MSNKNMVPEAEILDPDECWKLLAEAKVGRLAVIADGHPDVFPVNFMVDGHTLVFRTGAGTKQQAIASDSVVALEADALSGEFGLAWSVVVKGRAEDTRSTGEELNKIRRGLFPWQGVGQEHLIRITPDSITGRRFNLTAPMAWHTSLDDVTRAGFE
ncbi:pyridoxamine 5'-phosphate oxidase family protein [Pseudarthrobacter sp. NPDC058362]|uniref:pyridoxamine 5'-phosphate oxidase family protein n=1 Tax=unclassified Pseudarthrobacter TaxID=2647000 RepID=UPI0036494016